VIERATGGGRLVTAHQAAEHLGIRRSDLNHLVRTQWLRAAVWVQSNRYRRSTDPAATVQTVPLYRAAALDALLTHPAFDWDEIRATPRGRPSPMARLAPPGADSPAAGGGAKCPPAAQRE
jgi:hypothetical protein